MTDKEQTKIIYVGPPGASFGFRLAGLQTVDCDTSDELVSHLKDIKEQGTNGIVLVDEGLAEGKLDEVEKLNQEAQPAIVLVTRPGKPKRLAARKMDNLLIKAVGSDILN